MKRVAFVLTILTLAFGWGVHPVQAATETRASFTVQPVAASGIHADTAGCTDPNAFCLVSGRLRVDFTASTACTWTYTISWGDGTSVSHVSSTTHDTIDLHTYAPGEYLWELSGTGVSNVPHNTCLPFDFKQLYQVPGATVPIGGPISGNELLGGGSPSEPDIGCGCATSGDPVNDFSGNLAESPSPLFIAGRGLFINISETYNSLLAATDSPLGFGWTMSYLLHLDIASSGSVTLDEEGGSQIHFTLANGVYSAPPRVLATLAKNADGSYTLVRDNRLTYAFDSSGQLTSERDRNGYVTTLAYDRGQLSSITDSAGREVDVRWAGDHIIQFLDHAGGREVHFEYDSSGNLTGVGDGPGLAAYWRFGYDANHNMTSTTDPRGIVTLNSYDASHRVIRQTLDPNGLDRVTTWSYVANQDGTQTTTIVDPKGNTQVDTFSSGELTGYTRGAGTSSASSWSFAYDPVSIGRTLTIDPNGKHWTASYDAHGNVTGRTDPLGRSYSYTYDAQNDLLTATDPLGVTTTSTYDARGNLLAVSTPLGTTGLHRVTTFTYADPAHPGDLTAMTDPDGKTSHYTYDVLGNRTSVTDPLGDESTFRYNGIGWLLSSVSPRGNAAGALPAQFTTSYTRTPFFGDVASTTDPLGHTTTNRYDQDRNLISSTDALSHTTTSTYDAAGEQTRLTRADGSTLVSSFNADGTVATQTDAAGHATSYSYNPLAQLTGVTDPLGRQTSYTLDGAGNVLSVINPSGRVTTNTYDSADELTGTTYSDGTTPNVGGITYDANGRLLSLTDGTGTSHWAYDSLGRLTASTDGAGHEVQYGYDLKGQLTQLVYPGGSTVGRAFDPAGRLTAVTDWLGNTTTFAYDQESNLISSTFPGDQVDRRSYDQANNLTRITDTAHSAPNALFLATRNAVNLVSTATGVTRNPDGSFSSPGVPRIQSYGYTALNQVCSTASGDGSCVAHSPAATGYSYDAADNLTGAGGSTLSYDRANELTGSTSNGGTSYSYDLQGNRLSQTPTTGPVTTYSYDQANRLIRFQRGSTDAGYAYDGTGLRVAKTVNGGLESFVWDRSAPLPLLLQAGATSFLYGPNATPFEQITGNSVRYLHNDQLGSVRLLTDVAGQVKGTAGFDAYGNQTGATGERTPFGYAGEFTDAESSLLFLRARLYDPATGQFLSRDLLATQTREAYAYASGDPVNVTDPTGAIEVSGGAPSLASPPPLGGGGGGSGLLDLCPTAPNDGLLAESGATGSIPPVLYPPPPPTGGLVAQSGSTGSIPPVLYPPPPPTGGLVAESGSTGSFPPVLYPPPPPTGGLVAESGSTGGIPPVLYPPPPPTGGLVAQSGSTGSIPPVLYPPPPPDGGPVAESGSLATGGAV